MLYDRIVAGIFVDQVCELRELRSFVTLNSQAVAFILKLSVCAFIRL